MDDIDRELISLISTKIGMLMEDHSTQVLMVGSRPTDELNAMLEKLKLASDKIEKLVAVAQSIAE